MPSLQAQEHGESGTVTASVWRGKRMTNSIRPIVARQPTIECTVADTFERMQNPQGHYFTRPQGGVGMFGDAREMAIDLAE